jgi:hypothetical protein
MLIQFLLQDNKIIVVIPAKAGIHDVSSRNNTYWIPAFAGMTECFFCSERKME